MSAPTNLVSLFAEIVHGSRTGDWRKAFNAANKILQVVPDDAKAFQCKIVSMVHLSQFLEVVNLCKKNEKLARHVQFELAYSLYRLNRTIEALDVLDSIADVNLSTKIKELKAQVLYRLERCDECYELYRDIIRNTQDEYDDERETNLSAVVANMRTSKSSRLSAEMATTRQDTYELAYNAACALTSQQKFKDALKMLSVAEELCKKSLEEDGAADDEIDDELAIIRVQRAYTMQMMGKPDGAATLYGQVLKQKPSDAGLVAVASNNTIVINGEQNIFDSKKKMKTVTANELDSKLTNRQREVIAFNQCLLLILANQLPQCRELVEQLRKKSTDSVDLVLVEATLYCREKNESMAIEVLKKFLDEHPRELVKISFTLVELYLAQGMHSKACETLKSIGDISYKPGVVSALVSLYTDVEDKESATKIFKESIQWYKKNDPKSEHLVVLWRASANFHVNNGNAVAAAESLEELHRIRPKDVKVLAQLINAYSQFDPAKAVLASKGLPPVDEFLSKNVDVDNLESMALTTNAKYLKKSTKMESTPRLLPDSVHHESDGLVKKRKRKRKKKGKLPRNYDPNVSPDPERWLPRKERMAYKKRKERGARGGQPTIGKGTQGSTTGSADMDASVKSLQRPTAVVPNVSPGDRRLRSERPPQAMKKNPRKKRMTF